MPVAKLGFVPPLQSAACPAHHGRRIRTAHAGRGHAHRLRNPRLLVLPANPWPALAFRRAVRGRANPACGSSLWWVTTPPTAPPRPTPPRLASHGRAASLGARLTIARKPEGSSASYMSVVRSEH
ncbi:hypothetical protein GUJ93_ZPchr0004g40093 [Zizania palustris]|uniref:Uncharacterized protein n=1 Tax=Zizania palustris TaxID=103762 RepID=A0A8J5T0M5_ZIZPA|nr:hypothetical protein GUJ93_ZPchr0004g40093 [Zizania palustris]